MRTWWSRPVAVASTLASTLALLALAPQQAYAESGPGADLVSYAKAADSHCVTVVRRGKTVLSKDLDKSVATSQGFSVTKSVTSLLVGIAQDRGKLDLDDRVATYVPQWRGTASSKITIRHLLANTSGREWSLTTDYQKMVLAADKTGFSIKLSQQAAPGAEWIYNNSAIQVLDRVIEKAVGKPTADYAEQVLFGPLKMKHTAMGRDAAGNTMTFAGVASTCDDLAKLGVMLADGGKNRAVRHGKRIVSKSYLTWATQRPSSALNAAYGLLFWINEPGPMLPAVPLAAGTPIPQGPMVPAASDDSFWALGLYNQVLYVSPSTRVVAVRMGDAPSAAAGWTLGGFTERALQVAAAG